MRFIRHTHGCVFSKCVIFLAKALNDFLFLLEEIDFFNLVLDDNFHLIIHGLTLILHVGEHLCAGRAVCPTNLLELFSDFYGLIDSLDAILHGSEQVLALQRGVDGGLENGQLLLEPVDPRGIPHNLFVFFCKVIPGAIPKLDALKDYPLELLFEFGAQGYICRSTILWNIRKGCIQFFMFLAKPVKLEQFGPPGIFRRGATGFGYFPVCGLNFL